MVRAIDQSGKLHWRHVGLAVTAGMFSFLAVAVMVNTAGVFYGSIAAEFDIGLGKVSFYMTLNYLLTMCLLPLGGKWMDQGKIRPAYLIANSLLVVAFLLMANAQNIWMMYAAGVLLAGATTFDMYLMPVLVSRWFKSRTGFVIGLAGSLSGLGAALWNIVFANAITAIGWRAGYYICAAMILFILVPLCFIFVYSNPEDVGLRPYGYAVPSHESNRGGVREKASALCGADYAKVLKSPALILFIVMSMSAALCAMMSQYMTAFAVSVGYATIIGASMTSAAFVGTMLAKIGLGWLVDKSPFLAVLVPIILPIVGFIGLMVIGGSSAAGVNAMAFLYGIVVPSNTIILPMVVRKAFGDKDFGRIWGSISPFSSLACAVGATIWGWIYDGTGSFYGIFIIGIVLLLIRLCAYFAAMRAAKAIPHTPAVAIEEQAC